VAKKFKDAMQEDRERAKARAEKAFERPKAKDEGPKVRVLDDLTAAGSNGPSFEDIRFHFAKLKSLKDKVATANGEYQAARKIAKEAGLDPAVLSALMKREKQDPDEVKLYNKQLARAAQAVGLDLQLDLFDKSGISREAQIFDDGLKAGIAGKSTTDNPHDANTEAGQTWLAGWHLGQSRNVAGIGKTKQDSLGALN
jgi:ribosome modulation factor